MELFCCAVRMCGTTQLARAWLARARSAGSAQLRQRCIRIFERLSFCSTYSQDLARTRRPDLAFARRPDLAFTSRPRLYWTHSQTSLALDVQPDLAFTRHTARPRCGGRECGTASRTARWHRSLR
eukprot:Amastigsp_a842093_34.p2 type:complete len:125 gc:universal Amastigsp_a842093_34:986-612(-)